MNFYQRKNKYPFVFKLITGILVYLKFPKGFVFKHNSGFTTRANIKYEYCTGIGTSTSNDEGKARTPS